MMIGGAVGASWIPKHWKPECQRRGANRGFDRFDGYVDSAGWSESTGCIGLTAHRLIL